MKKAPRFQQGRNRQAAHWGERVERKRREHCACRYDESLQVFNTCPRSACQKGERVGPVTRQKSRDETRSRRQVTRRDETRDGLDYSVSIQKATRRDEIRDRVKKKKNTQIPQNFDFLPGIFLSRQKFQFETVSRDKVTRRDEIETVSSRLVSSRLFSRRDRLVSGPRRGGESVTLVWRSGFLVVLSVVRLLLLLLRAQ